MPKKARRRRQPEWLHGLFRFESRFLGVIGVGGAIGSFAWAIVALLDLDILRALAWLGLGIFLFLIGLGWWVGGESYLRAEYRDHERSAGALWRGVHRVTRAGRGSPVTITDVAPPPSTDNGSPSGSDRSDRCPTRSRN